MTGFGLVLDQSGQFSTASQLSEESEAHGASYGGAVAAELTQAILKMEAAYTDSAGRTEGREGETLKFNPCNAAYSNRDVSAHGNNAQRTRAHENNVRTTHGEHANRTENSGQRTGKQQNSETRGHDWYYKRMLRTGGTCMVLQRHM
jgi:hypothetical protein